MLNPINKYISILCKSRIIFLLHSALCKRSERVRQRQRAVRQGEERKGIMLASKCHIVKSGAGSQV